MKFIGIIILFLTISCNKEDDFQFSTDSAFYAIKNNSEWVSTSSWANHSLNNDKFIIVGNKKDTEYYQEERLHFIFSSPGISKLNVVKDFYAEWNFIIGGDGISDTYVIDSTYCNLIKIDSIDTLNKQINGTFEIKLVRDKFRSNLGKTLLYKNGTFSLNYIEHD